MKEDPILTIGIPTYNRPLQLAHSVRLILPQLNDKVKLIVRDNASDIPVITLFTNDELSKFTIIRNKVNIGGDANIAGVIYNCDTKWVWALGDDDYVQTDAISTIFKFIEQYPDELYINFESYIEKETNNFYELADLCKYRYVYSNFLFMSSGIYNNEKLSNDLFYYYKYLSSMIGQVIFVLKHLEHDDGKCLFTKSSIISHKGVEIVWSYEDLIKNSSIVFYAFRDKRKFLNANFFKGIAFEYYKNTLLNKNLSIIEEASLILSIMSKVGIINTFRYNYTIFIQTYIMLLLPNSLFMKIKEKIKKKYISRVVKNTNFGITP